MHDQVQVDPQLLFQRLIMACENSQLAELFRYELCTSPTSLFDSPLRLKQLQKPALAEALWAKLSPEAKTRPERKCATYIATTCEGNTEER